MPLSARLISRLDVGEMGALIANGAMVPGVRFTTSNDQIVTVDRSGIVRGISPGTATITISSADTEDRREIHVDAASTAPAWTIRDVHPRIRFTPDDLAVLKTNISQGVLPNLGVDLAAHQQRLLAMADRYVGERGLTLEFVIASEQFTITLPEPLGQPEPVPQPYGFTDYPFWTRLSRDIERRLITLALAWSLTGDERYGQQCRTLLLAICAWNKWHEYDKPTNNLSLPHLTMGAAIGFDEIHGLLSNEERTTVRQAIIELGLRPMGYWIGQRLDHNITVLMSAGMLFGALAIGDDVPHLEKYITGPRETLRWYLDQRDSSSAMESLTYTSYAMATLLRAAVVMRRATADDVLLSSPYLRDALPDLFFQFHGGDGGYANLADSHADVDPAMLMALLTAEFDDSRAAWIIARDLRDHPGIFPNLVQDQPVPEPAADLASPSHHFERIGWVSLRTSWDDDAISLAFVASPSDAGHNHDDQNHFILNVAGEWLVSDPGYQVYTPGPEHVFTTATIGHNGLLVNGEGQTIRGRGKVVAFRTGDEVDVVTGDATDAYDGRVERWLRTIALVQPEGYVVVVDDIDARNPTDGISLLFHTMGSVEVDGRDLPIEAEGKYQPGDRFRFAGPRASVDLSFLGSGPITVGHRQYPGAERFGTWLDVQSAGARHHRVVTLLQPRTEAGSDPLSISELPGSASYRIEGPSLRHDLRIDLSDAANPLVTIRKSPRDAEVRT